MNNYISVPNSSIRLVDGNIVILDRFPGKKWIVHNNWYAWDNKQYRGWYFSSIPEQEILPMEYSDLLNITIVADSASILPPCPPCPPCPPVTPPIGPDWPSVIEDDMTKKIALHIRLKDDFAYLYETYREISLLLGEDDSIIQRPAIIYLDDVNTGATRYIEGYVQRKLVSDNLSDENKVIIYIYFFNVYDMDTDEEIYIKYSLTETNEFEKEVSKYDEYLPKPSVENAGSILVVGSDGNWKIEAQEESVSIPEPDSQDSGKFLVVGPEGQYEIQEIDIPEDNTSENVEALKSLYESLGGDSQDVSNINTVAGMISAIGELGIDTDENAIYEVNSTVSTSGSEIIYTLDKTYEEIIEEYDKGSKIIVTLDTGVLPDGEGSYHRTVNKLIVNEYDLVYSGDSENNLEISEITLSAGDFKFTNSSLDQYPEYMSE